MSKPGRPSKLLTKHYGIKLTDSDFEILDLLSQATGLSKVDVIRQSLRVMLGVPPGSIPAKAEQALREKNKIQQCLSELLELVKHHHFLGPSGE